MLGDLIPAKERTLGSAYVTTVCGFGVFFGQMVGAMGGGDWHTPFVVLGSICLGCAGLAYHYGHEPERGANDPVSQQHQQLGEAYQPVTSFKHIRKTVLSPTNLVIWSQAFSGNIPWGIALVFLNDFMCQDLQLSMTAALLSINVLAFLSLLGNLSGGLLGRYLHTQPKWLTPLTASVCCVIRSSPLGMAARSARHAREVRPLHGDARLRRLRGLHARSAPRWYDAERKPPDDARYCLRHVRGPGGFLQGDWSDRCGVAGAGSWHPRHRLPGLPAPLADPRLAPALRLPLGRGGRAGNGRGGYGEHQRGSRTRQQAARAAGSAQRPQR